MTAVSVVFVYLASVMPSGQLGFVAIASLFTAAAIIEAGIGAGLFVFAGCSILSFLLISNKSIMFLYLLFFGYYPIIKNIAERVKNKVISWIIKLIIFNAALSAIWFFFRSVLFSDLLLNLHLIIIYALGNAAFVLFDIGFSKLMVFYSVRIAKH